MRNDQSDYEIYALVPCSASLKPSSQVAIYLVHVHHQRTRTFTANRYVLEQLREGIDQHQLFASELELLLTSSPFKHLDSQTQMPPRATDLADLRV